MPLIPTKHERRSFLEQRQLGLGSSDMAAVVGLDHYRDPMDIYISKVVPIEDETEMTIHQFRGIVMEPIIADLYAQETGYEVRAIGQRTHDKYDWARVNVDREIHADGLPVGCLECKAPSTGAMSRLQEFGIPKSYLVQLQWQMFVTGCGWGEFAIGTLEHETGPLVHFDQEPNDLLVEQLVERGEEFWTEYVLEHKPPHPSEWGKKPIEVPTLGDEERVTVVSAEFIGMAYEVMECAELRKLAANAYDAAREAAQGYMDERSMTKALVGGQGKVNYGWRKGRHSFRDEQLKAHGALDPHAVNSELERLACEVREQMEVSEHEAARALAEGVYNAIMERRTDLIADSMLDMTLFDRTGDAFRHFQVYPAKNRDRPEDGSE